MITERLFFFTHGLCSMFFIMISIEMFRMKNPSRLQRLLAFILTYWTILEVKDLAFYPFYTIRGNFLSHLLIMIDITGIPAAAIYLMELIKPGWTNVKRTLLLFALYILLIIAFIATRSIWCYNAMFVLMAITVACVLTYVAIGAMRYNRILANNYSNTENLNIDWLKIVTVIMVAALAVWLLSTRYSSWLTDSLYFITASLLWGVIFYHTKRMERVDEQIAEFEEEIEKENQNMMISHDFQHQLKREIENNEIYLNPKLTLSDLAQAVGTNRTYLSNYLNSVLHTTFYDYINSFRLERAIKMLEDKESTATTTEIAEACGFNSLSTFRRVFIREKGCSFIQYKEQISSTKEE